MSDETKNEPLPDAPEESPADSAPDTTAAMEAVEPSADEPAPAVEAAPAAVETAVAVEEPTPAPAATDGEAAAGGKRRRRGRGPAAKTKQAKAPKIDVIRAFEEAMLRTGIPEFRPGDTVKVLVKIKEGEKERLQAFEGVCIARKHGGVRETFTVRKISAANVGVERTFFLHSQRLERIELVRRGVVRRAKIYYLRKLRGKAARIRERRD